VAVSFIGGGEQSTLRKAPTCRKSQLKRELKKWEIEFVTEHKRKPKKVSKFLNI
jgi:hypothetical protein